MDLYLPIPEFSELTWEPHPAIEGCFQAIVKFSNGFGLSILKGGFPYTYTKNGTYEIAVLKDDELYETSKGDFIVKGYLTEEKLIRIYNRLKR